MPTPYAHDQAHAAFITQEKLDKYNPELYSPELQEILRHNLVMSYVAGSTYKGSDFLHKGDKILVREEPLIHPKVYNDNTSITYEDPESFWREFTINRSAYWAFKVRDIHELFSDQAPFAPTWIRTAAKELAESIETEWLRWVWDDSATHYRFDGTSTAPNSSIRHYKDGSGNDATQYGGADPYNMGNQAGAVSGAYDLGSDANPMVVYRNKADMDAAAGSHKGLMPDLIADAEACLHEQKGSEGLVDPWIIIPTVGANRIQTGELKNGSMDGNARSLLRTSVTSIGNFSGFKVYRSNLLPVDRTGDAPVYTAIFGDKTATSFVSGIEKQEMLRSESYIESLHRSFAVYDYFVHYPERLGVMKLAFA